MNNLFRNKEFKSIIFKLILLQMFFAIVGFIIVNIYINNINKNIANQNIALVGNIINNHPELEDELISYITKEIPNENISKGEEILRDYGYNINISKSKQPILKGITPNLQVSMFILIILFIFPLGYMIKKEYKKIYLKVEEVYTAAERVVEGDFSVYLKEEGEGDFNILNHQFNQMSSRLENSLEILKGEKVFLKDMVSDISHQLKTPLSSLIIINEIMLEDKNMDRDTKVLFINQARNQLERMEWLIINLLKVARIEAGAIEFKKEKVYLKDVVDLAISTFGPKLENQSIKLQGDLQGIFYGDKDWTGEALINIIKNSTEHGRGQIKIILEETPLFSSIIVEDNGEGIDDKDLPHIFDRFYKGSSEVKPESIGIGLNLSKLIVESQEGTITARSQKGIGTKITMTFLKHIT